MMYQEGKLREEDLENSGDNGEELQVPAESTKYGTEDSRENLEGVLPDDAESDVLGDSESEGQGELSAQASAAVEELHDEAAASAEILTQEMNPDDRGIFERARESVTLTTRKFLAVGLLSLGSLGVGAGEVHAQEFSESGRLITNSSKERPKGYDPRVQAMERNVEFTVKQLKMAIRIIDSKLMFLTVQSEREMANIRTQIKESEPSEEKMLTMKLENFQKNIAKQRDTLQKKQLLLTTTLAGYEKGLDDISGETKSDSPKKVDRRKTKPAPPRTYKQKTKPKGDGMPRGTGK